MEVSDGVREEVKRERYHGHWRVGSYFLINLAWCWGFGWA